MGVGVPDQRSERETLSPSHCWDLKRRRRHLIGRLFSLSQGSSEAVLYCISSEGDSDGLTAAFFMGGGGC